MIARSARRARSVPLARVSSVFVACVAWVSICEVAAASPSSGLCWPGPPPATTSERSCLLFELGAVVPAPLRGLTATAPLGYGARTGVFYTPGSASFFAVGGVLQQAYVPQGRVDDAGTVAGEHYAFARVGRVLGTLRVQPLTSLPFLQAGWGLENWVHSRGGSRKDTGASYGIVRQHTTSVPSLDLGVGMRASAALAILSASYSWGVQAAEWGWQSRDGVATIERAVAMLTLSLSVSLDPLGDRVE